MSEDADPGPGASASDDPAPGPERSLLRRVFLKLGATGAAGAGILDGIARAGPSGDAPASGSAPASSEDDPDGAASREVPAARFLPPRALVLSLRGLDADREFALSSVASDHDVARRPLSVRELVTPQTPRSTTDADTYRDLDRGSWVLGNGRVHEVMGWLDAKLGDRITWGNWLQDPDHMTHATVVGAELSSHGERVVQSVDDQRRDLIGTVVRTATGSFRGMGSGHSHSEAAMPDEGFNDLKDVDGSLPQPDRWIKDRPPSYPDGNGTIDTDHLIRVGAGTMLKTLNRKVLPSAGLALPNMGSWDGQTLAGAVNTATHGTGLGLGSLADIVRSVEILVVPESPTASGPLVRMLRVEPDGGITDPVAFARDAHAHDAALIQDDDLFHSVVVGYGSMGIVYAYTLECRDPFWLRETNEFRRWNDVDPVAEARNARHYKVNVNMAGGETNPQCWVRSWREVQSGGRTPTERKEKIETVDDYLGSLPSKVSDAVDAIGSPTPGTPPWQNRVGVAPFERDRTETASYVALRRRRARHPGEPEKPPEQPPDILSTEVIVPLSETEAAAQAVIDHVHRHRRWFPGPLSIRYAAGSEHYLSPEYGYGNGAAVLELLLPALELVRQVDVDEVYVEPGKVLAHDAKVLLNADGQEHLTDMAEAKRELEAVEDILVDRFDGRPHLGKHNTVDTGSNRSYMRPGNMYPEYDTWLAVHRYVNQFGTFDAKFTDNKVQ